jgi:hypothetical protein
MKNKAGVRGGRVSASEFPRLEQCPGSRNLIVKLGDNTIKESEWSSSGDLVHKYLATRDTKLLEKMNDQQKDCSEKCIEQRGRIITQVFGSGEFESFVEERLWTPLKEHSRSFSGQADERFVSLDGKIGLVIDYKSLFGDVPAAPDNLQIGALVVLAFFQKPTMEKCYGAIVQPPVSEHPVLVEYTPQMAGDMLEVLCGLIDAARDADAPLRTGDYCKWCPAILHCRAAKDIFGTVYKLACETQLDGLK